MRLLLRWGSDEDAGGARGPEEAARGDALRAERLSRLVGRTLRLLRDERMTYAQAVTLVETTRAGVLDLFPYAEAQYNLVLRPRFARVIEERFGSPADRTPAKVLPFRPIGDAAPSAPREASSDALARVDRAARG